MKTKTYTHRNMKGPTFTVQLPARVAEIPVEEFEQICEGLCRQDSFIIRITAPTSREVLSGQTYKFRHQLCRQIFYERQGLDRRDRSLRLIEEATLTDLAVRFPLFVRGSVSKQCVQA